MTESKIPKNKNKNNNHNNNKNNNNNSKVTLRTAFRG